MLKGLELVNEQRRQAGQPEVAEQSDHFHPLREGRKHLRQLKAKAERALKRAGEAQAEYDHKERQGIRRTAQEGRERNTLWRQAEQAYDRWVAAEQAYGRLREALRLFTPEGQLNEPARAQAEVQAALADLPGRRQARMSGGLGASAFTYLGRVREKLSALPVAPELLEASLRVEGVQARPELVRGDGERAQAMRAVVLVAGLVLTRAGEAGAEALALVQGVLRQACRASSGVENVNGVLRMHQRRQKRLTQELLDLKRLWWNLRRFEAGKRKGKSPWELLGLQLPVRDWWGILQTPPEQLRAELAALNPGLGQAKPASAGSSGGSEVSAPDQAA